MPPCAEETEVLCCVQDTVKDILRHCGSYFLRSGLLGSQKHREGQEETRLAGGESRLSPVAEGGSVSQAHINHGQHLLPPAGDCVGVRQQQSDCKREQTAQTCSIAAPPIILVLCTPAPPQYTATHPVCIKFPGGVKSTKANSVYSVCSVILLFLQLSLELL